MNPTTVTTTTRKDFWIPPPSAVAFSPTAKTHLWIAICVHLAVAYLKKRLKSELSIYETMQILGISVLDRTPGNDILTKNRNRNDVK